MAPPDKKKKPGVVQTGTVARNRRASYDYALEERIEAGLVLLGSEVKALRAGRADITRAWVGERGGELFLFNAEIGVYAPSARFGHEPSRERKLLVNRRQRNRMLGQAREKGMSLVPVNLYFNRRGIAKLEVAAGKGRSAPDRRHAIREREWKRRQSRILSGGG